MANERKTENIVRKHFSKYSGFILEEQQSTNPKINKLLKNASKQGNRHGKPDFIITCTNRPNFLIVIECKSDVKKHESATKNQYSQYAVDGVLLYTSFLSKEYDVLAIGVSGQTKTTLKVSHFLQLKNTITAQPIFSSKLLDPKSYIEGYIKSPQKLKQDYEALIDFAKELNQELHHHKILVSQRSLLISSILIALDNEGFRRAYPVITTPGELANYLVDTVSNVLSKANLCGKKLKNLEVQFSFIRTDTSLSTKPNVLLDLINSIDNNIHKFTKTHKYYDILGQLYIAFLKYANSDKGLGIVLTPPHITNLFNKLAYVNKESVVYDNCMGTGGFLISAMRQMINDANGDLAKIKDIKAKQLVGVEYHAHILALAFSNMYIHQDGKTNVIQGSCFDKENIEKVKKYKPTIGFLNPPYKADKKKDREELEFVLNNLSSLQNNGICVAILPMQCAIATRGKIFQLKQKLLEQHTLEAVLSMPDELFFNSDVGTVTCIMVFTAHKPHPKNKKTYFGYYKDDGFVKRKTKGRVDAAGKWEHIKDEWVERYMNRTEKEGISVNKHVAAKNEWCAEAYMETDYSNLTSNDFEKTLLAYSTFLYHSQIVKAVSNNPIFKRDIPLHTETWQYFNFRDFFEIQGSKTTSLLELEGYEHGKYPYVTTQARNNGIRGFYNYYTEKGGVLTIESAVAGYCSYQQFNFTASDHIEVCNPKFKMNVFAAMFLVTIINKEQYRYNYGRKASQARLKQKKIKLPAKNNKPDFKFMEYYTKSLPYSASITVDS